MDVEILQLFLKNFDQIKDKHHFSTAKEAFDIDLRCFDFEQGHCVVGDLP